MSFAGRQLDRYHLIRLIGQGGTGEVYLAEDQRITRSVAIKLVRSDPFDSEDIQDTARLFIHEAQTIAMFTHPHIQPLFDFGEENIDGVTFAYIVTAFCPDGSLDKWLEQRKGNPLLLQDVHALIQQAADALDYAHEHGVIHRNVKPPNFLVQTRKHAPDRPDILLSDFGIARLTEGVQQASSVIRGTPIYMAPEQWVGTAVPATDQYALAVIAYELLTGQPPFQGPPARLIQSHLEEPPPMASTFSTRVSPALDMVLLNALAKRPEDRFPSVSAFARAFEQAIQRPASLIVSVPREAIDGSLRAILSISSAEALTGTLCTITIPGGQQLTVTVPQAASTGYVIRMENPTSRGEAPEIAINGPNYRMRERQISLAPVKEEPVAEPGSLA